MNLYQALQEQGIANTNTTVDRTKNLYQALPYKTGAGALYDIANLIEDEKEREDFIKSVQAAEWIRQYYAPTVSIEQILANPEETLSVYGINPSPVFGKTGTRAVMDSLTAGFVLLGKGYLGASTWLGNMSADIFKLFGDEETARKFSFGATATQYSAQELNKVIAKLNEDAKEQPWYVEWLKLAAQTAPYSAMYGTAIAASALTANAPAMYGLIVNAGTTAASIGMMTGLYYTDLVNNGVDEKTARWISPVVGVINDKIERSLGLEPLIGKAFASGIAKKATYKTLASGALVALGKQIATTSIAEASEESLQAITEGIAAMLAETITEWDGGGRVIDRTTAFDIAKNIVDSATTALITTPILGAPAILFNAGMSIQDAKTINNMAKQASSVEDVKTIIENVVDKERLQEMNISIDDVASQVYQKVQEERVQEFKKREEMIRSGEYVYEQKNDVIRNKKGIIPSVNEVVDVGDGITQGTFRFVSPQTGKSFFDIEYTIKDNKIIVNDANIKQGYEYLSQEALYELARTNNISIQNVELEQTAPIELEGAMNAIKKNAIPESPLLTKLRQQMDTLGLNQYQKDLATRFTVMLARSAGKTVDQFLEPLAGLETIQENDDVAGVFQAIGESKYVIKLAEDADGGTLLHELVHFYRNTNTELFKDIEAEYGVENGKWTTDAEEKLVNDFLGYIASSGAQKKANTLFERIATFIKSVIGTLSNVWNDNVKKFFDEKILPYLDENIIAGVQASVEKPLLLVREEEIAVASIKPETLAERYKTLNSVKAERYSNGDWVYDAQLVAEWKKENGFQLSQNEQDILDMVKELAAVDGVPEDKVILFMSNNQRKAYYQNEAFDAGKYKTFKEYLDAVKSSLKEGKKLTTKTIEWLKQRFDWVHSNNKEVSLKEFRKEIEKDEIIVEFVREMINNKDELGRHPYLYNLAEKYRLGGDFVTPRDIQNVRNYLLQNNELGMYVFGLIMNNDAMMQSALNMIEAKTDIIKKRIVSSGKLPTILQMRKDLQAVQSEEIKNKLRNGNITIKDIQELIKEIKSNEKEYENAVAQLNALRRIQTKMTKYKSAILKKPSGKIDVFYKRIISAMIEILRSGKDISAGLKEIKNITPLTYVMQKDALTRMLDRLVLETEGKFNINELTLNQLNEILNMRKQIEREGRLAHEIRVGQLNQDISVEKIKALNSIPDKKIGELEEKLRNFDIITSEFPLIIEQYLSDTNKKILVDDFIFNFSKWQDEYHKRTIAIENFIKDHGLTFKLQRQIHIDGLFGINQKETSVMTASELLGAYYLVGSDEEHVNEHQRRTFVYNNLMSRNEKIAIQEQLIETGKTLEEYLEPYVLEKSNKIRDAYNTYLSTEEKELGKMIFEELNREKNYLKLATAYYQLTGKEFGARERFYFPLKLVEPVENIEDNIIQMLKGVGFPTIWKAGFVHDRTVRVSALSGAAVEHDIFKVFSKSVWQQEFLVNMGEYIKKVNSVYRGKDGMSRAIQEKIKNVLGEKGLEQLYNYIDKISSPNDFTDNYAEDAMLGYLRSSYIISTLTWRATVFANQILTSLAPVFGEARIGDVVSVIAESIAKNPARWVTEKETESAILKNRQRSILQEVMDTKIKNELLKKLYLFGMKGMDISTSLPDRYITAICWEAVKRSALSSGKTEEEAVLIANKHILETQPTAISAFRSPLYQNMHGFKSIMLMWTYPLNVMWQVVRHKVPMAVKRHNMKSFFGYLIGLTSAGIAQGLIQIARGRGPDDDEDKKKYILHSIPASVIEYFPFIGSVAADKYYQIVVGQGAQGRSKDFLPIVDTSFSVLNALSKEDYERARDISLETICRLLYLPVGAYKEYLRLSGISK